MNTFERHRQYLLRRQRRRRLIRHAVMASTAAGAFFAVWSILAYVGPDEYAPPGPVVVGTSAAREVAISAVGTINSVHAEILPASRETAKQSVLRLFDTAAQSAGVTSDERAAAAKEAMPEKHPLNIPLSDADTFTSEIFPPSLRLSVSFQAEDDVLPDLPITSAQTLDILFVGLDSRLGHERGRADALHLLTVDFNAPSIRITSIPRGTYSELGYENEASNIISNVRAARGRKELQRRIGRMCKRDSVPYYVEIGFSDAFGILELLGFENPGAELQALRQRKGYQFGDHNRCYNQGLFIRSAILRLLPILEGATGELLLHAGLDLVKTNLSAEQCRGIVYLLNDAGVGNAPSLITVTLRSRFRKRIERQSPAPVDMHAVPGLDYAGKGGDSERAERRIRKALAIADANSRNPSRVKSLLWTLFTQHAWLQLKAGSTRIALRDSLAVSLADACARLRDNDAIALIQRAVRADNLLFPTEGKQTPVSPSAMRP